MSYRIIQCIAHASLVITLVVCVEAGVDEQAPSSSPEEYEWLAIQEQLKVFAVRDHEDAPNVWPQVAAAGEAIDDIMQKHQDADFVSMYDPDYLWWDDQKANKRVRRSTARAFEAALKRDIYGELRDAAQEGRVIFSLDSDNPDPRGLVRPVRTVRQLTLFLLAYAHHSIKAGDYEQWLEAISVTMFLCAETGRNPGLLPALVSTASQQAVFQHVHDALRERDLDDNMLRELSSFVLEHQPRPYIDALQAELLVLRSFLATYFDAAGHVPKQDRPVIERMHEIPMGHGLHVLSEIEAQQRDEAGDSYRLRFPEWVEVARWFDEAEADFERIATMPATRIPDAKPIIDNLDDVAFADFIQTSLGAFRYGFQRFARYETLRLGLKITLALERYQLQHGAYPESLDALVPQFIEQIPKDPVNGKALGYRRSVDEGGRDGYVLYSFGANEIDNGGTRCEHTESAWSVEYGDPECDYILSERGKNAL